MSLFINTYKLAIQIKAPFLSSGLAQEFYGLDISLIRDHLGRIIIPGEQVLGVLRHMFESKTDQMFESKTDQTDTETNEALSHWFGKQGKQLDENVPDDDSWRHLKIFDLVLSGDSANLAEDKLTRIAIDDETGTARDGALIIMEQAFGIGKILTFEGAFRLMGSEKQIAAILPWIEMYLKNIPALGLGKGAGFGQLGSVCVQIDEEKEVCWPGTVEPGENNAVDLVLTFEHPFLVDPELAGNVYTGNDEIPGAVLKGVVARLLTEAGLMTKERGKLLSQTVFGFAKPLSDTGRPSALPQSLVEQSGDFPDRFETGADPQAGPAIHVSDLKSLPTDKNLKPAPNYHQRTRTAIGADGLAQDNQLFTYMLVSPIEQSTNNPVTWHVRLVPDAKADMTQFSKLVEFITTYGFPTVGKTAVPALAKIESVAGFEKPQDQNPDVIRLTLQTPAWLIKESSLQSAGDLKEAYQAYFQSVLGKDTELVNFASDEFWRGGIAAVRRAAGGENTYFPYLLTRPGSVFELRGVCQDKLEDIIRRGLPPWDSNANWKSCPFVRENGYGEVKAEVVTRPNVTENGEAEA